MLLYAVQCLPYQENLKVQLLYNLKVRGKDLRAQIHSVMRWCHEEKPKSTGFDCFIFAESK